MPPYQNESLHDMHALLQQLDTLNAMHSPDHLEMFEGWTKNFNKLKKSGNDMVLSATNRATEEEVIVYEYSQTEKKEDMLNMLLMTTPARAQYDELLKNMVKSPTLKKIIMDEWYKSGIDEPKQRSVYAKMHPTPPPK